VVYVTDRQRAAPFAALAGIAFATSAPVIADSSIRRGIIALPLLVGAVLLFAAGYYAGQANRW
jgi:hypothetical protein